MHNQPMNYSPIPRRKKRGISTVPQHLTKAPALTQEGGLLVDRLVVQLGQVDLKVSTEDLARISTLKTSSGLSLVVGGGAEGLASLLFRKRFL